ncbi:MAG: helix-turn-helix domain-containing protein [Clostridia bacterium]|nr:helix-turn-helix domain-containing protein [Clostridia bacterium]MDE6614368.1 helix-turn-helix domain-containing protein [Clostridia bacterium]
MIKFGERLKELRLEKNMTQTTLAKLIAVDRRTISNWENSTREPDLETFAKLTQILNTSADFLLGLE